MVPTVLLIMKFTEVRVMVVSGVLASVDRTMKLKVHIIMMLLISVVSRQWFVACVVVVKDEALDPLCSRVTIIIFGRKLKRKLVSGLIRVSAEALLVNIGRLIVLVVRQAVMVVLVRCYGSTRLVSTIMNARSATGIGAFGTGTLLVVVDSYTSMVNSIGP